MLGQGGLLDGEDALQARLIQGSGVFRVQASRVQLRVAHVEIPDAVAHEVACAVNVPVIEAAFLEPLLVFLGGEIPDRLLQVREQRLLCQGKVLLDAVEAVQLELQLLAFGGGQRFVLQGRGEQARGLFELALEFQPARLPFDPLPGNTG